MDYSIHRLPNSLTRVLLSTAGISLVVVMIGVLGAGTTLAQGYPPFPILYGGIALADGAPLPEGTRLVARVGDHETWTTVEENGGYRNLLVGPPDDGYYYKEITFHALGRDAVETDIFLAADAPVFKDAGFDLHFPTNLESAVSESPSDANGTTVLFIAAGLAIVTVATVAGAIVWRKRR